MANRQYVGARYVPKFADPAEWDNIRQYESLTIVTHLGNSFTSKKPVPAGVDISNTEYWVNTGNYNEQIDAYRKEVQNLAKKTSGIIGYGAKADGVTDDTPAFNAMLNAVGYVYLPAGTYLFNNLVVNKQCLIFGDGIDTVLKCNGLTVNAFHCDVKEIRISPSETCAFGLKITKSFCRVHDITIEDSQTAFFEKALMVGDVGQGAWNNSFSNVFINVTGSGFKGGDGVCLTSAVNNTFDNIHVYYKNNGISLSEDKTAGYSIDGVQFSNLNVEHCYTGIVSAGCANIFLDNSIFDQCITKGFNAVNTNTIMVSNCYISCEQSSLNTYKGLELNNCAHIKVVNTVFGGRMNDYGITLGSVSDCIIQNTQIETFKNGVNIDEPCKDVIIDGCYFGETTEHSIEISSNYAKFYNITGGGAVVVYKGTDTALFDGVTVETFTPDGGQPDYDKTVGIPYPGRLAIIGVPRTGDIPFTISYLGNNVCRLHKLSGNWDGQSSVTVTWIYPK